MALNDIWYKERGEKGDQGGQGTQGIQGEQGPSGSAEDLPVGSIMMFDANTPLVIDGIDVIIGIAGSWTDNITLPNWYACVDGNQDKGCPNLVDKFVMGKVVSGSGVGSGSNTHTLLSSELPVHTHDIGHNHSASSANDSHTHRSGVMVDTNSTIQDAYAYQGTTGSTGSGGAANDVATKNPRYFALTGSDTHNHTITVTAYSGDSDDGGFANDAIDTKPANYSLIFIRKCA